MCYRSARGCQRLPSLDFYCPTPGTCVIHTAHFNMERCGGSGAGKKNSCTLKSQTFSKWKQCTLALQKRLIQVTQLEKQQLKQQFLPHIRNGGAQKKNVLAVCEIKRQVSLVYYDRSKAAPGGNHFCHWISFPSCHIDLEADNVDFEN